MFPRIHHILASLLIKFVCIGSPNLSDCLSFFVDVHEGSDGSGCDCSAVDTAAEASSSCKVLTSVL